jgi:hypothetical protein
METLSLVRKWRPVELQNMLDRNPVEISDLSLDVCGKMKRYSYVLRCVCSDSFSHSILHMDDEYTLSLFCYTQDELSACITSTEDSTTLKRALGELKE